MEGGGKKKKGKKRSMLSLVHFEVRASKVEEKRGKKKKKSHKKKRTASLGHYLSSAVNRWKGREENKGVEKKNGRKSPSLPSLRFPCSLPGKEKIRRKRGGDTDKGRLYISHKKEKKKKEKRSLDERKEDRQTKTRRRRKIDIIAIT